MTDETGFDTRELERALGHVFRDRALLRRALVHRSWAHEHGEADHNEPLEFLGDAVIGFLVAERIVRRRPELDEGAMTRLRARLVNTRALADQARRLGLGKALALGRGEELTGGRDKDSLLADAFEAVIGALFLDGGVRAARRFVNRIVAKEIDESRSGRGGQRDAKTALQELAQARGWPLPAYHVIAEQGPDHARRFVVEVRLPGGRSGRGEGSSKKRAEQRAARAALEAISGTASDTAHGQG
ncbi:MAG: ribonuclease III [Acidobacteriota bacterium]